MRVIRIIPVTIAVTVLFMGAKFLDIAEGASALSQAVAETPATGEKPAAEAPKAEEPAKKEDAAKPEGEAGEKKAEAKAPPPKPKKGETEGNPAVSDTPGDITERHFSQVELDLLQNLAKRRQELELWEKNIQIKEAALDATQKRIDSKIQQIEDMKQAVSALLAQYNEKENVKIKSLVKIYENMKPGDAARIFNELEMEILLLVVDKMSEKKAAPILADMEPKRAKQLTVELAERRRLDKRKLGNGDNGGTP